MVDKEEIDSHVTIPSKDKPVMTKEILLEVAPDYVWRVDTMLTAWLLLRTS